MASNNPLHTLLIAFFLLSMPLHADEIVYKGRSGSKLSNIKITRVTYEGMSWRNSIGGGGTVALKEIASATFDNPPWEYDKGVEAMKEGRYTDAIAAFQKSIKEAGDDVWVQQYCLWRIARCQLRMGQPKDAGKSLDALLAKYKKTRYLPDALITKGRIALNAGLVKNALAAFKQLRDLAQQDDSGLDKKFYHLGRTWLAKTYLASKQADKALELFRDLRSSTNPSYPSVYLLSTIGEAQALTLKKEYSRARPLFTEAIKKAGRDEAILAQAYNGIGETYFSSTEEDDLHKALKAFLKVILLYDSQVAEMPKALWHASKCFGKLKGSNKAWAARSRELWRQLRSSERYRNSPWARKP